MASITLENLNKTYPNGFVSVKNLSLHIEDGEFVTFFGPSGCGKSTILRMIGGMEDITSGEIYLGKDLLNDILPRDRSLAMAFQNYQLYSHLNVYDNIALGLRLRNLPRQIIDSRVKMAAHFFNITDILEKKIRVINEAQKQRVAKNEMGVEFVEDVDKDAFREATKGMIEDYCERYPGVAELLDIIESVK